MCDILEKDRKDSIKGQHSAFIKKLNTKAYISCIRLLMCVSKSLRTPVSYSPMSNWVVRIKFLPIDGSGCLHDAYPDMRKNKF